MAIFDWPHRQKRSIEEPTAHVTHYPHRTDRCTYSLFPCPSCPYRYTAESVQYVRTYKHTHTRTRTPTHAYPRAHAHTHRHTRTRTQTRTRGRKRKHGRGTRLRERMAVRGRKRIGECGPLRDCSVSRGAYLPRGRALFGAAFDTAARSRVTSDRVCFLQRLGKEPGMLTLPALGPRRLSARPLRCPLVNHRAPRSHTSKGPLLLLLYRVRARI